MSKDELQVRSEKTALLPVATMVLWLACLTVGVAGLRLAYPRTVVAKPQAAVQVQTIQVEVTKDASPPPDIGAPPALTEASQPQPPAAPQTVVAPPSPPMAAVAAPSPSIAFALPVEGPSRIVDAHQADIGRPSPSPATAPSTVPTSVPQQRRMSTGAPAAGAPQKITFGEGVGKQPEPEYPREAVIARQEGTVIVRFTVGIDGRVTHAEVSTPCSSALLNQAAARAVREKWSRPPAPRFEPGTYEVPIEFKLQPR